MGNTTSKEDTASPPSNNPKCYYALLGLTPTATLADLRSSYRRLALLHHPDKNPGREEEATHSFAQIQHAYQVLSDPQERAWYDRIRAEQQREHHHPRRSGQNRWGVEEVMRLFEAEVYTGYDDSAKGFFSIFRQVFEHLESLEDTEEDEQVTFFGSLNSPFEPAVKTFYDKWLGFNSRRTDFAVPNDAYFEHYQQGTNRRDRRYLEKERDKQRDTARREYSEAVRNLAAYVRKRDPRYKAYLQQKKKAAQEQEDLKRKQAKEVRRQASFVQQEWTKLDKEEEELLRRLEQLDLSLEEGEEEGEREEYYCVACKKTFKSQKQWKNHEQSRKHLTELEKFKHVGSDTEAIESASQDSADEQEGSVLEGEEHEGEDVLSESSAMHQPESTEIDDEQPVDNKARDDVPTGSYEESRQRPPRKKDRARRGVVGVEGGGQSSRGAAKARRSKDKEDKNQIKCSSCKAIFDSRNQLFAHLKETGHARPPK